MTRAWLAQYRHYFASLLMEEAQLLDRYYCPPVPLEELFRTKIRPAVYFLQKCSVEEGTYRGPLCRIHPSEKAQLRLLMIRLVGTVVSCLRLFLASTWNFCPRPNFRRPVCFVAYCIFIACSWQISDPP